MIVSDIDRLARFASGMRRAAWHLCWAHWTSLGVSGNVWTTDLPLDLEAAIVLAGRIGRGESRMTDAVLDWLDAYGHLVNRDRLASVGRDVGAGDAWLARFLTTAGMSGAPGEPLVREARRKAYIADMASSARAILRLRSLCGPTTRADILLALAGGGQPRSVSEVIDRTRVSAVATRRALATLVEGGFVESVRVAPRDTRVRSSPSSPLASWLDGLPMLRDWARRYEVLMGVIDVYDRLLDRDRTWSGTDLSTAYRVLAHRYLSDSGPARLLSGLGGPPSDTPPSRLADAFEAWGDTLCGAIAERPDEPRLTSAFYADAPVLLPG